MKNFLITGFGRSGTLFLATVMNYSKKWTVLHEAGGYNDLKKKPTKSIQLRFNKDYYGEVNSYLRHHVLQLKVSKKATILRDPIDVWISMSNRKKPKLWNGVILEIENSYNEFLQTKKAGMKFFLFDRMVTEVSYLQGILEYVGIEDVVVTKEMQAKKVNVNKEIKYRKLDEFEPAVQDRIIKIRDIYKGIKNVI